MKRIPLLLFCCTVATYGWAQAPTSQGTQAREEVKLVPHEKLSPQLTAPQQDLSQEMIKEDARINKKNALHKFLLNRAAHKLNKAMFASVAKGTNEHALGAVVYVILVVLLILLIISLLDVFLPFGLVYVFGLLFLIILILWLLGVI